MVATFKKMTRAETIKVGSFLQTVCKTVDGFAVYDDGWSDASVADKFPEIGPVNPHTIGALRVELFGKFKRVGPQSEIDSLRDVVTALQQRIIALEQWANARPVKPFSEGWGR